MSSLLSFGSQTINAKFINYYVDLFIDNADAVVENTIIHQSVLFIAGILISDFDEKRLISLNELGNDLDAGIDITTAVLLLYLANNNVDDAISIWYTYQDDDRTTDEINPLSVCQIVFRESSEKWKVNNPNVEDRDKSPINFLWKVFINDNNALFDAVKAAFADLRSINEDTKPEEGEVSVASVDDVAEGGLMEYVPGDEGGYPTPTDASVVNAEDIRSSGNPPDCGGVGRIANDSSDGRTHKLVLQMHIILPIGTLLFMYMSMRLQLHITSWPMSIIITTK